MDSKDKTGRTSKGSILAMCPDCKGTGKVPVKPFFLANPKASQTRRQGMETCPRCGGTGKIGVGL